MPYALHRVKKGDELDQIAYDAYGHGELWWIVAMANGLSLPTDIYIGQILVVPLDHQSVFSAIENNNRQ
jgi:nucleoid-associated protein YgaU